MGKKLSCGWSGKYMITGPHSCRESKQPILAMRPCPWMGLGTHFLG